MNSTANKCFFPGEFSPPNKYDLMIAQWLMRKTMDVSQVIVVIGKAVEGEMTPEEKRDLWLEYIPSDLQGNIAIYKDESNSPLSAIYKMQERSPDEMFSIAVPESIAKNENFQHHFNVFPNYEIIITPKSHTDASAEMNSALVDKDFTLFSKNLPNTLSLQKKQEIFKNLSMEKSPVGDILNEKYWNDSINQLYNQYGI